MKIRPLLLAAAMLCVSGSASAQNSPENFSFEAGLIFWKPSPEIVITSGALGTPVDFINTFAVEDKRFRSYRIVTKAGKHKARFSTEHIKYDATTTLTQTIRFQGQTYTVGIPTTAELNWTLRRIGYEYDPVSTPRGFVGLVAYLNYNKMNAQLSAADVATQIFERNIPVRILNSWRPDGAGTLITAQNETEGTRLTGLASKKDVTVIDITSTRMLMAYGFLRRVFEVFERFRTAVDMVTTSEVSVSVTVDDRRNLDAIVQALSEFSEVSIEGDLALLCAVGDSLQGAPEIAARVVGVLEEVPLKMISQAASRRNITVVLRQSDLPHAMQRLHEEFFA